jgi:hypothetical protein
MAIDPTIEKKFVTAENNLVIARIFRAMLKRFNHQIFGHPMATEGD